MHRKPRKTKRDIPLIIGLTGSIGMGKSTVSRMFAAQGVAVCDSDKIVHQLLAEGGKAVNLIAGHFEGTRYEKGIDRAALGKQVFGQPEKLKLLESILHPLVQRGQREFIARMKRLGKKIVLLDIPLLFETEAERRCNHVVVVSAPAFIQRQRVLARAGMTQEKLTRILARQMSDRQKRKQADVVIHTGLGKAQSFHQVKKLLSSLKFKGKNAI